MIRKFLVAMTLVLSGMAAVVVSSPSAQAMDSNVRAVLVAGGYGIAGGTLLGLATLPLSQDSRSVFIGSSVGLYLGVAVGLYFISHRDDPDNPLRNNAESSSGPESRNQKERELRTLADSRQKDRVRGESQLVQLAVPVLSF
jgi:hypothetical protein